MNWWLAALLVVVAFVAVSVATVPAARADTVILSRRLWITLAVSALIALAIVLFGQTLLVTVRNL